MICQSSANLRGPWRPTVVVASRLTRLIIMADHAATLRATASDNAPRFAAAVECVRNLQPTTGVPPPTKEIMLRFYGAYKHAMEGPCGVPPPAFWDVVARAKHSAWAANQALTAAEARQQYIDLLTELQPGWYLDGPGENNADVTPDAVPAARLNGEANTNGAALLASPMPAATPRRPPLTPRHPGTNGSAAAAIATPGARSRRGGGTAPPSAGDDALSPHPSTAGGGSSGGAGGIYADFTSISETFSVSALTTPLIAAVGRIFSTLALQRQPRLCSPAGVPPPRRSHSRRSAAAAAAGSAGRWGWWRWRPSFCVTRLSGRQRRDRRCSWGERCSLSPRAAQGYGGWYAVELQPAQRR